ncbi:MAG: amidohydrolase family protein [Candidatus Latescibacterota bacterium]
MIYCCESYITLTGNPSLAGKPGGVDELISSYDEAGIDGAITLCSGPNADAADNRTVWEAMQKYPARIFGMYANYNRLKGPDLVEDFRRAVLEWGFKGYKGGGTEDALTGVAADLGVVVTIHTPASYKGIAEQAGKYPRMPIVMEHMGYRYQVEETIELARQYPNLYLGTTIPAASEPIVVKNAIRKLGAEKVLFGSNAPFCIPWMGVEGIRRLKLGKKDEELVLGGNFERLYRLK